MHDALEAHGFVFPCPRSHILPIVLGDNDRALAAASALQAEGFDVRAVRPPSVPEGTARLRLSINAGLDDDTIDRFAAALSRVFREIVLASASSASSTVESLPA
jgi:8-amino-7-oxononanoate synthase